MRVTSQTLPESLLNNLQRLGQQQYQLQNEAASGKKAEALEKSPSSIRRLINIQTDTQTIKQYQKNVDHATELATENYRVIRSLKTVSDRASEIAVKADSLSEASTLGHYSQEINQLLEEALGQANAGHRNQYLFAGTGSGIPPFVAQRDAEGRITGVEYRGNQSQTQTEIAPGVAVEARIVGTNDGQDGPSGLLSDSRRGADFFGHLVALRDRLQAGDVEAIKNNSISDLEADEDNFLFHLSSVGSLQTRLETNRSRLHDEALDLESQSSQLTDADLATTLVSLNQAQTAYQAALQSGAQMLRSSLMDYLR